MYDEMWSLTLGKTPRPRATSVSSSTVSWPSENVVWAWQSTGCHDGAALVTAYRSARRARKWTRRVAPHSRRITRARAREHQRVASVGRVARRLPNGSRRRYSTRHYRRRERIRGRRRCARAIRGVGRERGIHPGRVGHQGDGAGLRRLRAGDEVLGRLNAATALCPQRVRRYVDGLSDETRRSWPIRRRRLSLVDLIHERRPGRRGEHATLCIRL